MFCSKKVLKCTYFSQKRTEVKKKRGQIVVISLDYSFDCECPGWNQFSILK